MIGRANDWALLVTTEAIGGIARDVDLTLHELTELSFEQVYLELTADSLNYVASAANPKEARSPGWAAPHPPPTSRHPAGRPVVRPSPRRS